MEPVEELVEHLKSKGVQGVIAGHRPEDNMDDVVQIYLDMGWTLRETEVVHGKRVRVMDAPEGSDEET